MTKQQGSTHIGERMKAVTVYELMLMKERRDELETQRNELLKALREIAGQPCDHTSQPVCPREVAQAAVRAAS